MCSKKAREVIIQVECAFPTTCAKRRRLHCQGEGRVCSYLEKLCFLQESHPSHPGYIGKKYKNQILSLAVPASSSRPLVPIS